MNKQFNDLYAFIQVARYQSFSHATKVLNVQPSALSHRINELENRLNTKLLNRTTRSVATTHAGQQLFEQLLPLYKDIDAHVNALADFNQTLSGKIRINSPERAAYELIYPKLLPFLQKNPSVELELFIENRYVDIVAERFDFGVRSGKEVAQDMIAVQISGENKMAMVATPAYLQQFGTPDTLKALKNHRCISVSFTPSYRLTEWEFMQQTQVHKILVPESLIFSSIRLVWQAVLDGLGIAWLPYSTVAAGLAQGQVVEILSNYAISYPPMYLYYPKNKHKTTIFNQVINLLNLTK